MKNWFYIYRENGNLTGRLEHASDAAAVVSMYGDGATVRYNRKVVWTEGDDGIGGESYDAAATIMHERINN